MKTCSVCGASKNESEFYLSKGKLIAACKICTSSETRRRRAENPEKKRAQDRANWPQKLAAQRKRRENPEYRARELEKRRENLTRPGVKETRNSQDQKRGKDRRNKLQLLKMDRPCYDCGGVFIPEVLEWDHLPGAIKCFNISTAPHRNLNDVVDEIAKCQLVCANCHRIRTVSRLAEGTN